MSEARVVHDASSRYSRSYDDDAADVAVIIWIVICTCRLATGHSTFDWSFTSGISAACCQIDKFISSLPLISSPYINRKLVTKTNMYCRCKSQLGHSESHNRKAACLFLLNFGPCSSFQPADSVTVYYGIPGAKSRCYCVQLLVNYAMVYFGRMW